MCYHVAVILALSTLTVEASPTNLRGSVATSKSSPSAFAGGNAAANGNASNLLQKSVGDAPTAVMVTMLPPAWTTYGKNYTSCTLNVQHGSAAFLCLPERFSDLAPNGHTECQLANYNMFVRLHIGKLCSELLAEIVSSERLMATMPAPAWIRYGKNYTRCTLNVQHGSASFLCLPDRFTDLAQNGQTECQLVDYNMFVRSHIGMQCSEMRAESAGSDALTEDQKLSSVLAREKNSTSLDHQNLTAQEGWFSELSSVTLDPAARMGALVP